jgi:hypothetical protein
MQNAICCVVHRSNQIRALMKTLVLTMLLVLSSAGFCAPPAAAFDSALAAKAAALQTQTTTPITWPDGWQKLFTKRKLFANIYAEDDLYVLSASTTPDCKDKTCAQAYILGRKHSGSDRYRAGKKVAVARGVEAYFEPTGFGRSAGLEHAQLQMVYAGFHYLIEVDLTKDGKAVGPRAEELIMIQLGKSAAARLMKHPRPTK